MKMLDISTGQNGLDLWRTIYSERVQLRLTDEARPKPPENAVYDSITHRASLGYFNVGS